MRTITTNFKAVDLQRLSIFLLIKLVFLLLLEISSSNLSVSSQSKENPLLCPRQKNTPNVIFIHLVLLNVEPLICEF